MGGRVVGRVASVGWGAGGGEKAGVSVWCISLGEPSAPAPGALFLELMDPLPSIILWWDLPALYHWGVTY